MPHKEIGSHDEIAACSEPVIYPFFISASDVFSRASTIGYLRIALRSISPIAPSIPINACSCSNCGNTFLIKPAIFFWA